MLLLDRSGSMASLGFNPPQPLSDAKEAAVSFIKQLGSSDRVGIISLPPNPQSLWKQRSLMILVQPKKWRNQSV